MKSGSTIIDFPRYAEKKGKFLAGMNLHERYVETFKGDESVIAEELKKYLKDRLRKKFPLRF